MYNTATNYLVGQVGIVNLFSYFTNPEKTISYIREETFYKFNS